MLLTMQEKIEQRATGYDDATDVHRTPSALVPSNIICGLPEFEQHLQDTLVVLVNAFQKLLSVSCVPSKAC